MTSSPPPAKRMKADAEGGARDGEAKQRGGGGDRPRGLQPHDRLLGDWGAPSRVLAPSWLVRTHVALPGVPSPGAVQGNRVAVSRVSVLAPCSCVRDLPDSPCCDSGDS